VIARSREGENAALPRSSGPRGERGSRIAGISLPRYRGIPDHLGMLRIVGTAIRLSPLVFAALYGARHGEGRAVLIVAVAAVVAAFVGTMLLRTSQVGQFTWRNVLGSWLLPWGHVFGATTLPGLAAGAVVVAIVLACIGAYGWSEPWLLAAWVLDAIALERLLRSAAICRGDRVQRRVIGRVMAIVLALAAAGLVCKLLGHPMLGAAIAGGPLAVIGVFFGVYTAMFVVLRPRF